MSEPKLKVVEERKVEVKNDKDECEEVLIRILALSCRENKPVKPWNPSKMLAECCGDIIWSKFPGQYKECKCGESFVDQTRHYGRAGGRLSVHELGEDGND